MVSALKVGGERLHRAGAARRSTVERAPRARHACTRGSGSASTLPEARFRVRCSGGTYVRTLAHDLGRSARAAARRSRALRRLRSEPFGARARRRRCATSTRLDARRGAGRAAGIAARPTRSRVLPARARSTRPAARELGFGAPARGARPRRTAPIGARPALGGARATRDGRAARARRAGARPGAAGRALACPHVVFPWAVRRAGRERRRGRDARAAVAVGVFDGLHLGHRAILERARARARARGGALRRW